jgi:hypothetical protein
VARGARHGADPGVDSAGRGFYDNGTRSISERTITGHAARPPEPHRVIHELRIETSRPGRVAALAEQFTAAWRAAGADERRAVRAAWTSECGELNRLYTLWEHDADSGDAALAARERAARWSERRRASAADVLRVESLLLQPLREIAAPPADHTLFDFRMYDIAPLQGAVYGKHLVDILPVRQRYSNNFCVWAPLSGDADRIVHMWPYRSYEHRAEVRAQMARDAQWNEYLKIAFPLMVAQRSALLRTVPLAA